MNADPWDRRLTATAAVFVVLWTLVHVFFAIPSGDEGWYLAAARGIGQGHLPYLHSFFTQGPLAALVHAPIVAAVPTLIAARLQAALAWLFALWLGAVWLRADRLSGGRWWWLALAGASSFMANMNTLAMTPAYECLAVIASLLLWRRGRVGGALAVSSVAAAMRVSLAPWTAFLWVFTVVTALRGTRLREAWRGAWAGLLPFALLVGPFFLLAPERTWAGLVGYHLGGGQSAVTGVAVLKFKAWFWLWWIVFAAPVLAAALAAWRLQPQRRDIHDALLLGGALLLSLVHTLPATPYPKYQVVPTMLLALFAARHLPRVNVSRLTRIAIFALLLVSQAGLHWFFQRHLEFDEPPPAVERRVGREIGRLAGSGDVFLFEPLLAVEGGFSLPPGLEMGPFSLTTRWDRTTARHLGLLTAADVVEGLSAARWDVVAVHSGDLASLDEGSRVAAGAALRDNYRLARRYERVGQYRTPLAVFTRRAAQLGTTLTPPVE